MVWGLRFRVSGLGFGVGFRVPKFRVPRKGVYTGYIWVVEGLSRDHIGVT